MITACRANSTGDAVNHSLVDCLSDAFSVLCLFFPGLVVHTVVITVIVHVAGVAGVAYLLVPCSIVGPGADWYADGGHEPITDDEPDQESDESHAGVLDTVVSTAPQWAPHPEF